MCSIAGIIQTHQINQDDINIVQGMNTIQKHRGPDDEGLYVGDFCVLGHRRLSIIDLSKNGHQPFVSDDGRYLLIYNGEIYNYIELREELIQRGHHFKTKTDTEVLLKAYEEYGKECLRKFNGMFAFAIYDVKDNSLFLARDRVGIKPLYYTLIDGRMIFASEIKALRKALNRKFTVNRQALFDYLIFNRTDVHDETFVNEIKRLPKGHYAQFSNGNLTIAPWWNPEDFLRFSSSSSSDLNDILNGIEEILVSAVTLRMRSDVPVGSCLSGGLDSTILLGILYEKLKLSSTYSSFTVSFPGHPLDETKYIDALNQKYPFVNHRTSPSGPMALANLRQFVYTNDEPTTGPSFYSQYELMKLVKEKGVTVLIDGQGGDENFAGYQYFHGFYLNGLLNRRKYGRFLSNFVKIIARRQQLQAYQTLLFQVLPGSMKKFLLLKNNPHIKKGFFDQHVKTSRIYNRFFDAPDLNTSLVRHFQFKLEHLLRMEDRNSMAFSIESRLPYLDYRLIEYTLGLSEDFKIKSGETKYLQKLSVGKYTIPDIINRQDKIGFGTPAEWLESPPWKNRTCESTDFCEKEFPEIFQKNLSKVLPRRTFDLWKINQIAVWHEMINN